MVATTKACRTMLVVDWSGGGGEGGGSVLLLAHTAHNTYYGKEVKHAAL